MNSNDNADKKIGQWQLHHRLYNWVLSWAQHKYGPIVMVSIALVEPIFLPIPADLLLVAMCLGKPKKALRYGALVSAFSILGGCLAFGLGLAVGGDRVLSFFEASPVGADYLQAKAAQALDIYERFGFWAVAISALTPVPYMLFSWLGGFARISFWLFLLTSLVFRTLRFFSQAVLIYLLGEKAKPWIDKYFNLVCCLVIVLLGLLFILSRWMAAHVLGNT
jgi:membrane protein YqaA with SNARE-associated domain